MHTTIVEASSDAMLLVYVQCNKQHGLPCESQKRTLSFSAYALPSSRRGSTSQVMTVAGGRALWSALITAKRGSVASSGRVR